MRPERIPDERPEEPRRLWAAALDAERETGRHEEDDSAARASLVVRVARITAGTLVSIVGLSMILLPGPGLVVVAAGLSILAIDVPFAQRLLQRVRARLPQTAGGGTPTWLLLAMGASVVVAVGASVAWMVR